MVTKTVRSGGTGVPAYLGYLLVILGVAVLVRVGVREGRLAVFGQSADGVIVALGIALTGGGALIIRSARRRSLRASGAPTNPRQQRFV